MQYSVNQAIQILEHTPPTLDALLRGLPEPWVVHDLGHIRQIARTMAKQYRDEIGPWGVYLPVVND